MTASLSAMERALVTACFASGQQAREAWERWRDGVDWTSGVDPHQFLLLPQLHRNLVRLGVSDPLLPTLQGVRRRGWYSSQRILAELAPLVRDLARLGTKLVLLPPSTLLVQHRTLIADGQHVVRLAVPGRHAEPTFRHLAQNDWRLAKPRVPRAFLKAVALLGERARWRHRSGIALEFLWGDGTRGLDAHLPGNPWSRLHPAEPGELELHVLDATDAAHFLLRQSPVPKLFAALAVLCLSIETAGASPDWQRLAMQTRLRPVRPEWCAPLLWLDGLLPAWKGASVLCRAGDLQSFTGDEASCGTEQR